MGRVKFKQLSEKKRMKYLGDFYDMVSELKGRDEVKNFLKDLLTLSETVMIARRIQIAILLIEGKKYDEIVEEMGVGKTTISHVDKWVNEGFGGYRNAIKKHKKNKKSEPVDDFVDTPFSLSDLKKRYPAHFMLLNLLDKK